MSSKKNSKRKIRNKITKSKAQTHQANGKFNLVLYFFLLNLFNLRVLYVFRRRNTFLEYKMLNLVSMMSLFVLFYIHSIDTVTANLNIYQRIFFYRVSQFEQTTSENDSGSFSTIQILFSFLLQSEIANEIQKLNLTV